LQLCELVAQLARSGSSSVSISAGFVDFLCCMGLHLLGRIHAALFFCSGVLLGLQLQSRVGRITLSPPLLPFYVGVMVTPTPHKPEHQ